MAMMQYLCMVNYMVRSSVYLRQFPPTAAQIVHADRNVGMKVEEILIER